MATQLAGFTTPFALCTTAQAVALFAPTFTRSHVEELRIAHLDQRRSLIALRFHGGSHAEKIELPLQEIAREALVLRTHGLVMAHNHPSGNTAPSTYDIAATRNLAELAHRLGIRLYDHLIFADEGYSSLLAMGLL